MVYYKFLIREKVYIIKSKKHIKLLHLIIAFLKMNMKNSILNVINCKILRFNLCNDKLPI